MKSQSWVRPIAICWVLLCAVTHTKAFAQEQLTLQSQPMPEKDNGQRVYQAGPVFHGHVSIHDSQRGGKAVKGEVDGQRSPRSFSGSTGETQAQRLSVPQQLLLYVDYDAVIPPGGTVPRKETWHVQTHWNGWAVSGSAPYPAVRLADVRPCIETWQGWQREFAQKLCNRLPVVNHQWCDTVKFMIGNQYTNLSNQPRAGGKLLELLPHSMVAAPSCNPTVADAELGEVLNGIVRFTDDAAFEYPSDAKNKSTNVHFQVDYRGILYTASAAQSERHGNYIIHVQLRQSVYIDPKGATADELSRAFPNSVPLITSYSN